MSKEFAVCALSVSIGIFFYLQTNDLYDDAWVQACNDRNDNMEQWLTDHPGLVTFAKHFEFGAMKGIVCRQTQLYYQLNENNASAITGMLSASISMPLLMAILLEAGRGNAEAALKLPLIIWILVQEFGLAVVFPLLWLPLYCFFKGGSKAAIHPFRVYASLPLVMPQLVLTILIFWLNPGSTAWNNCVGLLASPILAGCTMVLSFFPDPSTEQDTPEIQKIGVMSRRLMALMYGAAGLLSLAIWLWLVFLMILPTFGLSSFEGVYNELWANAPKKLRCKTLEVIALYISGLLYIGVQSPQAVVEALGISALFGPGAGICMSLAGVAVSEDMEAIAEAERKEQNKDKKE